MRELPDKLSELMVVALEDLASVEADPRYVVFMGVWHQPLSTSEICAVCLGGAVMAMSLDVAVNQEKIAMDFDDATAHKLRALDDVRFGLVSLALYRMRHPYSDIENVDVVPYRSDPALWRSQMEAIVTQLRERGL